MKCGFCQSEIEERLSCNPAPFKFEDGSRVCGACDSYVSATRMILPRIDEESQEVFLDLVQGILEMSHALRMARLQAMKQMYEMMNKEEEE